MDETTQREILRPLHVQSRDYVAPLYCEKFPRNVDCRTTHSLAFRPISAQFRFSSGKTTTALNARQLAEAFELKDRVFGRIKLDPVG